MMTLLSSAVLAANIVSNFESKGDGTMMHYTYLKEPELEENGYTRGYKAGSFSYFSKGSINYSDTMEYDDGRCPQDGNSSVSYNQKLHFNGSKGISEFYGKGFYPSNRAISAWKKIRYDDLSYNKSLGVVHLSGSSRIAGSKESSRISGSYGLGESYMSSNIDVAASVKMGPVKGKEVGNYDFKYNAAVLNGILEIRDATGWTNRTGALRVDWERDAVMRGNFNVTNDLFGENLFFPAADADRDWLSCCIGGDYSKLDHANDDWPNRGTYGTLAPKQVLPSKERTQNCSIIYDPNTGYKAECTNLTYKDFNCTTDDCSGFECIYQITGTGSAAGRGDVAATSGGPSIEVKKWILSNESDSIKYQIDVHNSGSTWLENVNVTDVLPVGMEYEKGKSRKISSMDPEIANIVASFGGMTADEDEPINQTAVDLGIETAAEPFEPTKNPRDVSADALTHPEWNLTWTIPKIQTDETVYIYLNVNDTSRHKENVELNMVYAEGTWMYGNETVSNAAKAEYRKTTTSE